MFPSYATGALPFLQIPVLFILNDLRSFTVWVSNASLKRGGSKWEQGRS